MSAAPITRHALSGILMLILGCLGCLGCAGNKIAQAMLPDDMIAVRMWENEDARRRNEMLAESTGRMPQLGMMDLSDFTSQRRSSGRGDGTIRYPGRLALINPRTLEVTFPEQAPLGARPLSWSADRERLIFASDRQNGRFQIYELDFAAGEVRVLAGGGGNFLAAAYAPDEGFVYGLIQLDREGDVETRIYRSQPRMRDRVLAEGVAVRHITYSPDGRYVAFTPQSVESLTPSRRGLPRLIVQAVEVGGARKELGPGLHPVFSPDGAWIVYAASRGNHLHTYRVRVDGTGRTPVGVGVRDEKTPAVSPDGKFVAYVSPHNGLNRLFVKRFDGTGDRLLFDGAAVEWPIW